MFPFQSGELSFQVSNDVDYTNHNIITNDTYNYSQLVEQNVNGFSDAFATNFSEFNHAQIGSNNSVSKKIISSNKRKQRSDNSKKLDKNHGVKSKDVAVNNVDEGKISESDVAQKKIIHREVERQRRQEMATLFSSLRSILPVEYTKGKRSMSDHIAEATKYIKDLELSMKDLRNKRNHLKASCSSSTIERSLHGEIGSSACSTSSSSKNDVNVSIHTFSKAIEVEICAGVVEENTFPLSKVLGVLTEEGLDVVSCVSSEVSRRKIYVIHVQVEDVTSIDLCQLQCRLHSEICDVYSTTLTEC